MSDEYLTFEQASILLNTPRSTLYRWLKAGRVPGHKLGRQWRFLRSELEAFRNQPERFQNPEQDPLESLHDYLLTQSTQAQPMDTLQENLIWTAFDQGATALYIQPKPEGTWSLLKRSNEGIEPMTQLSADAFTALIAELQIDVPDEFNAQSATSGSWKMIRGEDHLLVRHQNINTALGSHWTFRLIRTRAQTPALEQITTSEVDLQTLQNFLTAPYGLLLISGPSGSGKTTTAHSCLNELAQSQNRMIFTMEPSTEFLIPGVNQVAVDLNDDSAYRSAFEQIMHSDPDVLFLSSTYAPRHRPLIYTTALNAAEEGHLVLVQLEADSAEDALERFQSQVERPVDDLIVGVTWQELIQPTTPDEKITPHYEWLSGPLSVSSDAVS